jgi:hypothetical protein
MVTEHGRCLAHGQGSGVNASVFGFRELGHPPLQPLLRGTPGAMGWGEQDSSPLLAAPKSEGRRLLAGRISNYSALGMAAYGHHPH